MATVTTTVTINAAFLQEIKEDSQSLRRLLHHGMRLVSAQQVHASRKQLADFLAELRDELGVYLALEEAYGYFEDAICSEPRLSRRAEALREQHREMFLEVCALEEKAERLLYHEAAAKLLREIAAGYQSFYEQFLDHESAENALIQQAFAEDIGAGD